MNVSAAIPTPAFCLMYMLMSLGDSLEIVSCASKGGGCSQSVVLDVEGAHLLTLSDLCTTSVQVLRGEPYSEKCDVW